MLLVLEVFGVWSVRKGTVIDMKETPHVMVINPLFVVLLLRQRVEATGVSNPASVMRNQSRGSSFQRWFGSESCRT